MDDKKCAELLAELENPKNVRFADLVKICTTLFGEPRNSGSSHYVWKMPWAGDPRINLQKDGKHAKPYQVKQVVKAIERLMDEAQKAKEDDDAE